MKEYIMHIENPAYEWENATPVGNGSMGAMVYGTISSERIQLNEESIWSGEERDTTVAGYKEKLDYIRKLFLEGKNYEADVWAEKNLGDFGRVHSYETAGALYIDLHENDEYDDYIRDLDLNKGIANVSYFKDGGRFTRECFASHPDKLIVYKISSDVNFDAGIRFERKLTESLSAENGILKAVCRTAVGDNRFCVMSEVKSDGEIVCTDDKITVKSASFIEIYTSIATTHKVGDITAECEKVLKSAEKGYDDILKAHVSDFSSIMERSDINLGSDAALDSLSIKDRLRRLKDDESLTDFGLISMYFQFGKYLLVSSSRYDTLPANLQGVWAESLNNPWGSDYHTNINLQMNYWHAEVANISECTNALFTYMNDYLLESGKKTADVTYGCRGTVVHHLSDLYKFTTPADGLWGLWPLGGAWLCYHMWEHYLYTGDAEFLKNIAYDYIKESALFFIDYMFEDENGQLLSGPSTSPENRYFKETDGERKSVYLCLSPTMDIEIIGGLLKFYIEAEKILGIDPELAKEAERVLSKMPPLKIGKHGQLMEWLEDYDEPEPGHRHISHAFDLYPGCGITRKTPDLFGAIETTLDRRLSHGGGHTGWSRAWLINLFARLGNGKKAYDNLIKLFTKSTKDNLFDTHPPFQIDGNFGGAAGIAEMLIQSHEAEDGITIIRLLPAVPDCYESGSFERLCARGGFEISAKWENKKVTEFTVKSKFSGKVKIELPYESTLPCENVMTLDIKENDTVKVSL